MEAERRRRRVDRLERLRRRGRRRSSTAAPIAAARPTARAGRRSTCACRPSSQGAERADYVAQARRAPARARLARPRLRLHLRRAAPTTSSTRCASAPPRSRRAVPGVPRLVTRVLDPTLRGSVDIWCPMVNFLDDKPGNSSSPPRSAYDAPLAKGERLWWYQACMSHGCNIVGGDYFTGWPSYVVDAPAMSHRIMEWLTFRYRVGGELYYDTVEAYAQGKDPWRDQLLFGGNGDGTLFYPGRARTSSAGTSDVPVESVRLAAHPRGARGLRVPAPLRQGRRATKAAHGAGRRRSPARPISGSTTRRGCTRRATRWPRPSTRRLRPTAESALLLASVRNRHFTSNR